MNSRTLLPILVCVVTVAARLAAHPMGNFSVSHYLKIQPSARGVDVIYALDLAEIPTFELLRQWNVDAASAREVIELRAARQAREWVGQLGFQMDGRFVSPAIVRTDVALEEGAGGLPVMRVTTRLRLAVPAGRLEVEDRNFPGRAGWKEVVVVPGDGVVIEKTSHDARDRSDALTAYPQDSTAAPPQDLRAFVEWKLEGPVGAQAKPAAPLTRVVPAPGTEPTAPSGAVARGDFLSRMLGQRDIPWNMALLGVMVAFGLGAVHAFSPGHGKTLVAAYLVGSRGTFKHAAFLGAMVTFTHTISVFLLGLTTLFLSSYVVPEKIYPVLGAISGLSIVVVGASLLYKRVRRMRDRGHDHDHHHHDHDHGHDHSHSHSHAPEGDVTLGGLIALGASGGLVPCPSALVLLLSSVALGRVGLGLLLLVGFSLGLSVVLIAIGMLVLYARHLIPDSNRVVTHPLFRLVPVLSAAVIVFLGLLMTGVSLGWLKPERLLG